MFHIVSKCTFAKDLNFDKFCFIYRDSCDIYTFLASCMRRIEIPVGFFFKKSRTQISHHTNNERNIFEERNLKKKQK